MPYTLSAVFFMVFAAFATCMPLYSLFLKRVGLSGVEIGIITGLIPAVMIVSQPVWGLIADLFGKRRALIWCLAVTAVLCLVFLLKLGFLFYFFLTLVLAFFMNPLLTLVDSISLDRIEEQKKGSYGKLRLWGSVGWAVATTGVGYLITDREYSLIFVYGAVLFSVTLGIVLIFLPGNVKGDAGLKVSFKNLSEIFEHKEFMILLPLLLLFGIGTVIIHNYYGVYLESIGASNRQIGLAFSIQAMTELPFFFFGSYLVRKYRAINIILFAMLLTGIRLGLYGFISEPVLALSLDALHGACYGLFIVSVVEYINQIIPSHWRATGQSLFWAFYFGLGMVLGNFLTGTLMDLYPISRVSMMGSVVVLIVFFLGLIFLRERKASATVDENC